MRTTTTAATIVVLLATLAACSDDPAPNPPATPAAKPDQSAPKQPADTQAAEDKAALEKAVRKYTAAYFKPDADTGYAMVSARCKETMPREGFEALLERASGDYGEQDVKRFAVDQLSGDMARVTYGVGLPLFDQKQQPWVREAGAWHFDAC